MLPVAFIDNCGAWGKGWGERSVKILFRGGRVGNTIFRDGPVRNISACHHRGTDADVTSQVS
jgi:hypothetical protein